MICENLRSASLEEIGIALKLICKESSSTILILDNLEKVQLRRTGAYRHKKALSTTLLRSTSTCNNNNNNNVEFNVRFGVVRRHRGCG